MSLNHIMSDSNFKKWNLLCRTYFNLYQFLNVYIVKPCLVDTSLQWTPAYSGHVCPVPPKTLINLMYKDTLYSGHLSIVYSGHQSSVPVATLPVHSGHFPPEEVYLSTIDQPDTFGSALTVCNYSQNKQFLLPPSLLLLSRHSKILPIVQRVANCYTN